MEKVVPGQDGHPPTLASVYMRKTLTPLPKSGAGRASIDRLTLNEITRLGELEKS